MTKDLIKKLCCPMDKHDLDINIFTEAEDDENEVLEALMTCPKCHRYFPVIYGVPILIPDEYRDRGLEEPLLAKWGFELQESGPEQQRLLLSEGHRTTEA